LPLVASELEDALDDGGFALVNFVARLLGVRGGDLHVAIGGSRADADFPLLSVVEFTAPLALDNLLAFVFGTYPLPLAGATALRARSQSVD
jgi:hypothetical protein